LVRGYTVGPDVRCLPGCWAQPSGLLRHAGEAINAALVQTLRALNGKTIPVMCNLFPVRRMQGAALRGAESSASVDTAGKKFPDECNLFPNWLHPAAHPVSRQEVATY
jgi:hypothetical protein